MNRCRQFAHIFVMQVCLFSIGIFAQKPIKIQPKKFKIKKQEYQFNLGENRVKIVVSKTTKQLSKFVYFNMHDNENTAIEAAKNVIQKYGGTLIELRNDDRRMVNFTFQGKQFTFDPNRIFTRVGIAETLKQNGEYSISAEQEVDKFAARLKSLLKDFRLIIAIHNNTDENYSLKSYENIEDLGKDIKFFNENPAMDTDDFFFVTETKFFQFLKSKNQNVALQDNENVTDDGSLSVYCGKNKIEYLNVESQHEHLDEQIKMLELLQKLLKSLRFPKIGLQK